MFCPKTVARWPRTADRTMCPDVRKRNMFSVDKEKDVNRACTDVPVTIVSVTFVC